MQCVLEWWAYLEEVQVLPQRRGRSLVVVAQLPDHDAQETDERGNGQRHRRDDARDTPCFPHVCDVGVE